jgi:dolichol-phosphate mannosyltransferase
MISIVVPAYNEERNIDVLYARLRDGLAALLAGWDSADWELIVVDDGSTDGTWDRVTALSTSDARVRGVRLARNFGHQAALLAGLSAALGKAVISIDADLQHPPEVVPLLIEKWREGFQIVHGVRRDRPSSSRFKRFTSRLYYRLFSYLSGVRIEPGAADFRLLDRQVLDEILKFREEGLFLRGIVHWVGYSTASVPFDCGERHAGTSGYSLRKMLSLAWHGISSFSLVPLRIAVLIGLVSSALAFLGVGYAIVGWWLDRNAAVRRRSRSCRSCSACCSCSLRYSPSTSAESWSKRAADRVSSCAKPLCPRSRRTVSVGPIARYRPTCAPTFR